MLLSLLLSASLAATCAPGQSITADTAGQCCWSGQVWSKLQHRCVGVPACPGGTQVEGERCVTACPAGQTVSEETAGRCCWPNQVWSSGRNVCVGIPACAAGWLPQGESCVPAQQPPPPPPPQQFQPPPQATPPPAPVDTPYAAPAQVAPTDDRAQLQAQLKDLKQQHRSIGYGGNVVGLVLGIPALPLGIGLMVAGFEGDEVGIGILGILLTGVALPVVLISALEIPTKVRRKAELSRQIRATEDRLNALGARQLLIPLQQQVLFAVSSPVFEF